MLLLQAKLLKLVQKIQIRREILHLQTSLFFYTAREFKKKYCGLECFLREKELKSFTVCRAQQKQTAAKELLSSSGLTKCVYACSANRVSGTATLTWPFGGWEYTAHPSPATL